MENPEHKAEIPSQEKPFSPEFKTWMESNEKLKELLEGSHVLTEPWDKEVAWEGWEVGRRFIASVIDKDGTILDYGCANGFLLRSLQEWSEHKLDPYGFDIDQRAVARAKELFPDKQNHFVSPEEQEMNKDFPKNFDFVYWNVWDNWKFEKPEETKLLQKLQTATKEGGRLILGLYDTKEENLKRVEQLKKLGFQPSGILENPRGEQMLVLFDKTPQKKHNWFQHIHTRRLTRSFGLLAFFNLYIFGN